MAAKKPAPKRKPAAKLNARKKQIALVLVDAAFMGETEAATLWKIARRTVYNYWDTLQNDPEVAHFFTIEKNRREEQWAARLNGPILKALEYFDAVFTLASKTDPDTIVAATAAMNALVEAKTIAGMTHESFATDREATAANTTLTAHQAHDLGSVRPRAVA